MNDAGSRRVYLPAGNWVDFWSGACLEGGHYLPVQAWPMHQIPVFARQNASIRIYPHPVRCTDDMDLNVSVPLTFDASYKGFAHTLLQQLTGMPE
jgi:alpha-D-xyloside xylohydrolase